MLVDDQPEVLRVLAAIVDECPGFAVVAEATSGEAALVAAAETQPDLVLMDVNLPGIDGVEATRRIVDAHPHVAVLVLTMHDDDETVFAAVRAGARGYLLKGAPRAELVRAVTAVAAGEAIFGPAIARRLVAFFDRPPARPDPAAFPELTDREREILELIARGRSNSEITAEMVLSPKTVRNNVSNVLSKLQVRDRAEAIVRAREAGLGTDRSA
jgi:DNA-binding NarL/FixJ family response regulator